MNILVVSSSANGDASVSNGLVTRFVDSVQSAHPAAHIVLRDVGANPLPHLTAATVAAIKSEPATPAEHEARALSDSLIAELQQADVIVIASPMYNFGMSSTLKAWFDHVLRAGVTFRYTEAGPEGLLTGKKTIVIESRAGFYSDGPAGAMDGQEPHIRTLLGFVGLDDVTYVRAEKLAFGQEAAFAAIAEATEVLETLAREELKLAA
ncbi:NAD(P)H-dependent oxidoreductase [Sphingosinicella sp. LHD-64]|uniref:FMN-dependent NADH-azoreductase n=1 Tax=Sphingosinicella sp. LHD-64 TaxID=3072139 RepID=UPI00280ECD45|nr:NAD(P)H-dependent oxidoreductase [Sphingosinicella sp. LHD-64]MDQ8755916.1 NAD(P)H-dependent oxidoreductase [Sphingosinicella sp. LHD-64]